MHNAPWPFNKNFSWPEEPWNEANIICFLSVIFCQKKTGNFDGKSSVDPIQMIYFDQQMIDLKKYIFKIYQRIMVCVPDLGCPRDLESGKRK